MKIALAFENPNFISGVEEGFMQFFTDCKEQRVDKYVMSVTKEGESLGKSIKTNSDRKMWNLRQTIDEKYDFLVVVEDGLYMKSGNFFYNVVAFIQKEEEREAGYWGTSCGIMIPFSDNLEVMIKRFSTMYSDDDLIEISRGRFSYEKLAQQAIESALTSMFI